MVKVKMGVEVEVEAEVKAGVEMEEEVEVKVKVGAVTTIASLNSREQVIQRWRRTRPTLKRNPLMVHRARPPFPPLPTRRGGPLSTFPKVYAKTHFSFAAETKTEFDPRKIQSCRLAEGLKINKCEQACSKQSVEHIRFNRFFDSKLWSQAIGGVSLAELLKRREWCDIYPTPEVRIIRWFDPDCALWGWLFLAQFVSFLRTAFGPCLI